MNSVGRLFICIVGGVVLCVTARGATPPGTPTPTPGVNAFHQNINTNALNRLMMLRKRHSQSLPPGFQFPGPGPGASQPNVPPAKSPQVTSPKPFKGATATDTHPKTPDNDSAVAATPSASGNPYESIVTRNVFGLNPIPPDAPQAQAPPGPPPPKITLTGIMTIFGPAEALFKVAGVVREHGQPHDESYIFTEGEMQDEVQVARIDTNKMVVSFINHGVQQDLGLTEGVASTGSAPSAPTFPGQPGRRPFGRFFNRPSMGGPGNIQRPDGGGYNPGANNNTSPGFNNAYGGSSYNGNNANNASSQSTLSADDQAALIAAEHAQAIQQNSPIAPLFPQTKYDPDAMKEMGGGGNPNPSGK